MTVVAYPRIWDLTVSPRNALGTPVTFRYSSHARHEFNSDTGHDEYIEARIKDPGVIHLAMFSGTSLSGSMEVASVNVVLINDDGGLDFLRTYAFDGCAVQVRVYDQVDVGGFAGMASEERCVLLGEQALFDEGVMTLSCRDYRHKLDQPLLNIKYAGTNTGSPLAGIEGTANDLKGHAKPFLAGTVFNVTPSLVNTDKQIYQLEGLYPYTNPFNPASSHAGGLVSGYTLTVYDKRSALTRGADYTSQANMEATVPTAGQYRVWPAGACFRLGSVPLGRVTCDVTNPPFAGASNALQDVCRRLVRVADHDGLTTFGNFDALWTANPQAGIYINDDGSISVLSALEQALGSIGAFITDQSASLQGSTGGGAFAAPYFFQLNAPGSLPYTPFLDPIEFDRSNIVPGSLQQVVPPGAERGLPVWRVNVNYKRNYTVMSDADLAGVAAADAEFCKKEWRTVDAHNSAVLTQWPDSIELTFDSLLVVQSEAQAEANRLFAMFGVRREMFRCRVKGWAVRNQAQFLGFFGSSYVHGQFTCTSVVKVTYPRFGMDAGRTFVAIAIEMNLDSDEYDVVFWG